jgi:hypothetical protein
MSNLESNVNYKINKLYDSSTLFEKYGVDVWITIIIIMVLVFATGYYYILNHLHSLKKDWVKIRCNPLYMPFAGFINKDSNLTNMESTFSNFTHCLSNIIETGTKDAVDPIYYLLNSITTIFNDFLNTFNVFRKLMAYLRRSFEKIYTDIITRIVNICIPLLLIFVKLKDSMSKLMGILTASMFAYLVESRLMKIYIINIGIIIMLEVFVPTLITTIITYAIAFGLMTIPFPPAYGVAAGWATFGSIITTSSILITIFTFLCLLIIFTNQIYKDTKQNMPAHPPMV